jgi:hypothetical protein
MGLNGGAPVKGGDSTQSRRKTRACIMPLEFTKAGNIELPARIEAPEFAPEMRRWRAEGS